MALANLGIHVPRRPAALDFQPPLDGAHENVSFLVCLSHQQDHPEQVSQGCSRLMEPGALDQFL